MDYTDLVEEYLNPAFKYYLIYTVKLVRCAWTVSVVAHVEQSRTRRHTVNDLIHAAKQVRELGDDIHSLV